MRNPPVHGSDVVALTLWTVGGMIFAARRFRWEPAAAAA
jgi:hypothetical protein